MTNNMVEVKNITKKFGANTALDNVSFNIKEGEVHALLGENGAGKSTMLNILHGIITDYEGNVRMDGQDVKFHNATEAINFGISKVHQEVTSVTELTAGQNIALGYEPKKGPFIDYNKLYEDTDVYLKRLGCNFNSRSSVKNLSVGEIQMIVIAKALYHNAKVISFDEPTSALTDKEINNLMNIIDELKAAGITILYVTHRLDEVFRIADSATVLRDGKYIETMNVADINKEQLINKMVGRDVSSFAVRHKPSCVQEEVVMEVEDLELEGVFHDVDFKLHKGEILSFSGLIGSKRTDVMLTIFGEYAKTGGQIKLHGEPVEIRNSHDAVSNKIALIPENRKTQGFVKNFSNSENMALASMKTFVNGPFVDVKAMDENAMEKIKMIQIHPPDPNYITASLSGGNAQKVIIGKWLTTDADIIIFDEPTKGIDVGAKAEIYKIMEDMVAQGKSIIMVSSELPEIIGMSDRVVVMREGRKVKELERSELSEEVLLHYAMEG